MSKEPANSRPFAYRLAFLFQGVFEGAYGALLHSIQTALSAHAEKTNNARLFED